MFNRIRKWWRKKKRKKEPIQGGLPPFLGGWPCRHEFIPLPYQHDPWLDYLDRAYPAARSRCKYSWLEKMNDDLLNKRICMVGGRHWGKTALWKSMKELAFYKYPEEKMRVKVKAKNGHVFQVWEKGMWTAEFHDKSRAEKFAEELRREDPLVRGNTIEDCKGSLWEILESTWEGDYVDVKLSKVR